MFSYIIRRILLIPVLLLGVSMLIFGVISLMKPIDRAQALFSSELTDRMRARDYEGLVKKYGLDDPVHIQYWRWLVGQEDPETGEFNEGVLYGNLGWSQVGRDSIANVIARRGPATLELILWALIPMIGISIWLGVTAAVNHNKLLDHILRITAVTGWSIPAFAFGMLLILIFSSGLGWFPPGRLTITVREITRSEEFINYTQMYTFDALLNWRFEVFEDAIRHLALPVFTLAAANGAFILRITRFSMLETLGHEYVTTARSKGLPEEMVVRKHALKNALNPVITASGLTLVNFLNSVVITEVIFNFPGLGSFLAESAISLDLVSVAGVTLFSSVVLILVNLLVDVLYVITDPRVRLD